MDLEQHEATKPEADRERGAYFPSRMDVLFAILLYASIGVLAGTQLLLAFIPAPGVIWLNIGSLAATTLTLLFLLDVVLYTGYRVTPELLTIRSGPIRYRIPTASIAGVRRVFSLQSAPALSASRVRIYFRKPARWCGRGKAFIDISPRDRDRFMPLVRTMVHAARSRVRSAQRSKATASAERFTLD